MKIIRESIDSFSIQNIEQEDILKILDICVEAFEHLETADEIKTYLNIVTDWDISKKAVLNNEIIGCYLFNEIPVVSFSKYQIEDLSKYKDKKGLQGVALVIKPEYRGLSYGRQLREIPLKMGYDYVWGQHLKGLDNIDSWMRFGRRVVADNGGIIVTLMDLDGINEGFQDYHQYQDREYTCGPTCIRMVADYLNIKYNDINEIITACEASKTSGTTDKGIKKALEYFNIRYKQNDVIDKRQSINFLDVTLSLGDVFIMRTLTREIKHWIIIFGKDDDEYLVADPWLGVIKYKLRDIIKIWEPRNFDGFAIYI